MSPLTGLLYSQVGYDLGDPMRTIVRSTQADFISAAARFTLLDNQSRQCVLTGPVTHWGEKWGSSWWVADFSTIQQPGEFVLQILDGEREVLASDPLRIGANLLWDESVVKVALDQLEERSRLARYGHGWLDCGIDWREANSHATMLIGLCDLLNIGHLWLSAQDKQRAVAQIVHGCDYLGMLQDQARRLGHPAGVLVHELPNHGVIIPGDQAQAASALAHAARLIAELEPGKSVEYLRRAEDAFRFVSRQAKPYGSSGFLASNHGAPEGYVPTDWMTRDLLMILNAALELVIAGRSEYQQEVVDLGRRVMARQVPQEKAEGGLFGHFYTFGDGAFSEKANTHHHVGHDTGSTFPHYLVPFIEMGRRWYDHPDAPLWRKTLENFAYGYLLPACSENPFYLLPEGYFNGEGLLCFCGPWHGINTSYGFAAGLATELEMALNDAHFRQIAVGNLQWIAGLHAGITAESLAGCLKWKAEIPPGQAVSYSQIWGVGRRYAGGWNQIPGTICNGFAANPQFQFTVPPTAANDAPGMFTDEDWIPHAAGWISGLARLRQRRFFKP
jgi:hypothetical protein